uniref:Protein RER1 n=2 Tax=Kalanchoe fedtschenkoi TaxID=63787 RepID=A0A7N0ZRI5_KALFE
MIDQMEGLGGENPTPASSAQQMMHEAWKVYQYYLDKSIPYPIHRWIATVLIFWVFFLRVYLLEGFYIVAYGVGIYILNLLIAFLSPLVDPETEPSDGPMLPTRGSDEFKPFIRRLPEFKFWHALTKAFGIGLVMTFFSVFDVPVFWPILLFYWIVLFVMTMKRQIAHMIKYKYIPFTIGKQRYGGKKTYGSGGASPRD